MGADLIGYFAPHEGSLTTAYAAYNIDSLADYEAYRARLAADPAGRDNHEFARREQFIRREDRIFLKQVSGATCRARAAMIASSSKSALAA